MRYSNIPATKVGRIWSSSTEMIKTTKKLCLHYRGICCKYTLIPNPFQIWIYWKISAWDLGISVPAATVESEVGIWVAMADPSLINILNVWGSHPQLPFSPSNSSFWHISHTAMTSGSTFMPMTLQLLASALLLRTKPILLTGHFLMGVHTTLNSKMISLSSFQNPFLLHNSLHQWMTSPYSWTVQIDSTNPYPLTGSRLL